MILKATNVIPNDKPMFDSLVEQRLTKAIALAAERGGQYGDTLANNHWLVLKSVFHKLFPHVNEINGFDSARLAMAAMVDIKYQRFEGGWKADNIDDGINYAAVLAELMEGVE